MQKTGLSILLTYLLVALFVYQKDTGILTARSKPFISQSYCKNAIQKLQDLARLKREDPDAWLALAPFVEYYGLSMKIEDFHTSSPLGFSCVDINSTLEKL